jgi:hypothetical protein
MKKIGLLLPFAFGLTGCGHMFGFGGFGPTLVGSGRLKSESRSAGSFHRIDVGGAMDVTVKVGPKQSIEITADDNLLSHIRSRVDGGTLIIDIKGSTSSTSQIRVAITVPSLDAVEASGATKFTIQGLHTTKFAVEASGASHVHAAGSANVLNIEASGASKVDLSSISATTAQVEASGASNVRVQASQAIEGSLSGASNLTYAGNAKTTVDSSGASNVHRA